MSDKIKQNTTKTPKKRFGVRISDLESRLNFVLHQLKNYRHEFGKTELSEIKNILKNGTGGEKLRLAYYRKYLQESNIVGKNLSDLGVTSVEIFKKYPKLKYLPHYKSFNSENVENYLINWTRQR